MESRWDTGRTEAFSDGVFAIAITLLVLDINVPESDFDDLWQGIAHQWPSYLGYVTSFATIGGLWLAHHGIFRRIQYADARVTRLNLLLLMVVSFLPFPTRLMAETIRDPTPRPPQPSSTARRCSRSPWSPGRCGGPSPATASCCGPR